MKRFAFISIVCGTLCLMMGCSDSGNAGLSDNKPGDSHRGLSMITPSEQWREALPSGNGTIGALVYGNITSERVIFNHNELWYGGKDSEVPDMSGELPVVRKMMLEGRYAEANEHYRNKMLEKGLDARNAASHPAFDMILTMGCEELFEDYSRTLDFETGEVEVGWTDGDTRYSRRLFVSIPDNISVMSIRADRERSVSGTVTLDIHDLNDAIQQNGLSFDPGFTYSTTAGDGYVEFRADGSDGGEFGGLVRIIAKNGELESIEASYAWGRQTSPQGLSFESADEVLLLVAVYANKPSEEAIPALKEKLNALEGDYESLFDPHKALHGQKFNSMGIDIAGEKRDTPNELLLLDAYQNEASTELLEKLFDYGRYLLISSSTAGGYPANLQGLWNGDYRPPWNSLLGINENLQMTYWQALPGNLEESIMAFYDFFDGYMDQFRYNARQLWGCDGIYIPPFMSPESGIMRHTAPHVVNWTDAAGWLASYYYDYYLFTGDEDFLRNRAIPFMEEVALFYEDFVVKDERGKNMFFPSQSPENNPADKVFLDPETGRRITVKVQINSTITFAIAKEVLTNLIEACDILEIEAEGLEGWKKLLADMPEYQINEDGAIKEWMHPDFRDNYEHRHQSHIYPLFPGYEIREETNPELYEACKIAIDKRLVIGLGSQTGWSLAHMANVYARLEEGEGAVEALNILSRCCLGQNFFTYHNDWRMMGATLDGRWGRTAPFQMDANFGIPAAVIEMLCASESNMLRILPALPSDWTEGSFHGILSRTGVTSSAKWDMSKKMIEMQMEAGRNTSFDLKFPGTPASLQCSEDGILEESAYGENYRSLALNEGQEITLTIKLQ